MELNFNVLEEIKVLRANFARQEDEIDSMHG